MHSEDAPNCVQGTLQFVKIANLTTYTTEISTRITIYSDVITFINLARNLQALQQSLIYFD